MIDSQLSYESRCQYLRAVSSSGPSSRWRSRRLIRTSLWCQSSGPSAVEGFPSLRNYRTNHGFGTCVWCQSSSSGPPSSFWRASPCQRWKEHFNTNSTVCTTHVGTFLRRVIIITQNSKIIPYLLRLHSIVLYTCIQ